MSQGGKTFAEIYRIVRRIPRGRVASYGDVAARCRADISARTVGWAMWVCPPNVPWHRVVNQRGLLTIGRRSPTLQELQRNLLLAEGVTFLSDDQLDIEKHRWRPRHAASRAAKKNLRKTVGSERFRLKSRR